MSREHGPLEGSLLGGAYRVGKLVGEGSMGAVYEGTQEGLGRPVAIKVLKARGTITATDLERFGREARAAAALGHPNIVQVTDFRADSDPPFLVMERLSGESMRAVISREKRLPVTRVAILGSQILDALGAAHRGGIVHRDIKPDNVFLTRIAGGTEVVKVLDFGVAKLTTDRPITAHGALMGSPAYMAPEQATGNAVDARTDLWAVGATLYHALAGKLPFDAGSMAELLTWLLERHPPPLAALVPGIDPRMVAVIERALTKDPSGRFASAGEMQAALEALVVAPAASVAQVPVAPRANADLARGSSPSLPHAGAPSAPDFSRGSSPGAPPQRSSSPGLPPQRFGSAPDFSRGSSPGAPPNNPPLRHPSSPDFSRGSSPGAPPNNAPFRPPSSPDFSRGSNPGAPSHNTPHPGPSPIGSFGAAVAPLGRQMPVGVPMAVGVAPPVAESEPRLSHANAPHAHAPSAPRLTPATAPMHAQVPMMHTPLPSSAQSYGQIAHGEFRASYPGAPARPPSDGRTSAPPAVPVHEARALPRAAGRGWLLLLLLPAFFALFVVIAVLAWLYVERTGEAPATTTTTAAAAAPSASGAAPAVTAATATNLPAGWKRKAEAPRPCTALRIAPYDNGKAGAFNSFPEPEANGLGSQLAAKVGSCTQPCAAAIKTEHYMVRVAYDGAITEARPPGDVSKCDARDHCVDTTMRTAKVDPPPNAHESIVEVVCTFP